MHSTSASADRAASIFGNATSARAYKKACRAKDKNEARFAEGSAAVQHLSAVTPSVIGDEFGVRQLVAARGLECFDIFRDANTVTSIPLTGKSVEDANGAPVVIGSIRMGFGHYRIAMAMCSAAHAMGYTPYWLDLMSFPDTACTKIIEHQNELYSLGSCLSQKIPLFNTLFWEPLNSQGFRKLSYNASDQKVSELMTAPFADLPASVPFVGTHAWTSQVAVHAGIERVVNAIPDNWPMALHLAEGSIHTVQTPSSFLGYKTLRGMAPGRVPKPMPPGSLVNTGHYVDHELVESIEVDCARRVKRLSAGEPMRYLLSIGGAGAQQGLFKAIIEHLVPYIERDEAVLLINAGDHGDVWNTLAYAIPALQDATVHFDDFADVKNLASSALDGELHGIHAFCDRDIFSAVYSTNLLMRCCDVLITKPSELSFYPVPKIMIKRVGGHEAWGAIRAAEIGDGTFELESKEEICGFIDLVQDEPAVVADMCFNICCEKSRGTYDGAYRVMELAMA